MRRPRMRAARLPRCRRPPQTPPRIVVRRAEADRSWGESRLCQVGAGKSAAAVATRSGYGAPRRRKTGAEKAAAPPATPRHPNHPLPLLPSGPGGVCGLSSRGDRRGHHRRSARWPGGQRRLSKTGGERGIRTLDTGISRIHTFQACSFNHSDISPQNTPDVHPAASQRSPGR